MKKIILILLISFCFLQSKAQYIKSSQIMIFTKQSDLVGFKTDAGQLAYCLDIQSTFIYNGSIWLPSARTIVKKNVALVNGKVTGATLVYTLESSPLNFYPIMVIFRAVSVSGVTTAPTVSIGTNATAYNNVTTGSLLNTLLATLGATAGSPQLASVSYPLAGGSGIYANVTTAAIATNYSFYVEVIGFYDN